MTVIYCFSILFVFFLSFYLFFLFILLTIFPFILLSIFHFILLTCPSLLLERGSAILSKIPVQDLADLLVLCVRTNHTGASMLSRSSAVCGTKKVQGPTTWTDLVEAVKK